MVLLVSGTNVSDGYLIKNIIRFIRDLGRDCNSLLDKVTNTLRWPDSEKGEIKIIMMILIYNIPSSFFSAFLY